MNHLRILKGLATKGKRGKKTMATVAIIPGMNVSALNASVSTLAGDRTPYCGTICMTCDAMKNAGVRSGVRITIRLATDVALGKTVPVLHYEDIIARRGGAAWGVVRVLIATAAPIRSISIIPHPSPHPPHHPMQTRTTY